MCDYIHMDRSVVYTLMEICYTLAKIRMTVMDYWAVDSRERGTGYPQCCQTRFENAADTGRMLFLEEALHFDFNEWFERVLLDAGMSKTNQIVFHDVTISRKLCRCICTSLVLALEAARVQNVVFATRVETFYDTHRGQCSFTIRSTLPVADNTCMNIRICSEFDADYTMDHPERVPDVATQVSQMEEAFEPLIVYLYNYRNFLNTVTPVFATFVDTPEGVYEAIANPVDIPSTPLAYHARITAGTCQLGDFWSTTTMIRSMMVYQRKRIETMSRLPESLISRNMGQLTNETLRLIQKHMYNDVPIRLTYKRTNRDGVNIPIRDEIPIELIFGIDFNTRVDKRLI